MGFLPPTPLLTSNIMKNKNMEICDKSQSMHKKLIGIV